ncbi:MAG TPA: hypothetical protein VH541_00870 [Gaiellaceae bacterium]|jgi:hypothetical protein
MGTRRASILMLVLLAPLLGAACGGGGTSPTGHTVTFVAGGNFPTATIVGTYSVRGCAADARTLVQDARLYYRHSTGAPGPADLYYYDLREAFAHLEADGCTHKELGEAMKAGLTPSQRTFLLHNVASDLHQAFQAALGSS